MAWDFAAEIHALSGFNADLEGITGSTSGEYLSLHTNQWLTQGAKEIINILPSDLKMECSTMTSLTSTTPMDLDASGPILHVTRENDDNGFHVPCRQIPSQYGGMASSSSGHMMYEASVTDPVYWTTSDTGGDPKLFVKPDPTANQPARVHHIAYPTVAFEATAIVNFPDEAAHLVVLYAAIKATEYMMLSEEDQEVYGPQLQTLKHDYQQGLESIGGSHPGKDIR